MCATVVLLHSAPHLARSLGRAWAFGSKPVRKYGRREQPGSSGLPNESLQLPSARSSEGLRLGAYWDASASLLVSRILSRPLAAELER